MKAERWVPPKSRLIPHPSSVIPSLSRCHCRGLLDRFFDGSHHVKSLLRKIIMLTVDNLAETSDGVFQFHVLSFQTGKLGRNEERLREEALNLARARNNQLVFVGELVQTENGNDVLEILVALQDSF